MRIAARTALFAATGAVALAGTGIAVAQADPSTPTPAAGSPGHARLLTPEQRATLTSTGHLSTVRHTPRHGDVTVLVQRGVIEAIDATSIRLRSKDGYDHTYVITAATKVREKRRPVAVSTLHTGERAMVVAVTTPGGDVARRIACVRPARPDASS